ncbi:MAG: hypothetical protein GXP00_00655 [Alphaproteobacteria bacterium]|nr:hypothetical protein [Alphaproteobacteria bacterium]
MQKQYTLARTIAATTLITIFSSSTLMAAECEIKNANLLHAYSKAVNNGARFKCLTYNFIKRKYVSDATVVFLPLPNGLKCYHKKLNSPKAALILARKSTGYSDKYRLDAFNKNPGWPLNGWKISRYSTSGGGQKKSSSLGGIIFQDTKSIKNKWSLTLKKIWLKKAGGSCSNINTVIREAFGN